MIVTPAEFIAFTSPEVSATARVHRFVFRGNDVLVGEQGVLPSQDSLATFGQSLSPPESVGSMGDHHYVAHWLPKESEPPQGFSFQGMRALWALWDDAQVAIAGRAFQLQNWLRTHRYCGVCGTPTHRIAGERGVKCPSCGFSAYPRISPAMMVLITKGDSILLASNVNFPPTRYSALAGFLEAGENIEEAVHREVFEEVGLAVKDLRYFASQSWPYPHSLMIGFTAEYAGGEIVTQPDEIRDARFYAPGDPLPDLPPRQSIARALIESVISRW
jgi:NAD+ diphosphatase